MPAYVPEKVFCNHLKKNSVEAHCTLKTAFGDHAMSLRMCCKWYEKFNDGNFDIQNETRGRPDRKFDDVELEELLAEGNSQTQKELALQL